MTEDAHRHVALAFILLMLVVAVIAFAYQANKKDAVYEELSRRKEADAIQHCVSMHGNVSMRYDPLAQKFDLVGCNVPAPLDR